MRLEHLLFSLAFGLLLTVVIAEPEGRSRKGKLSVFEIVRFPNDACEGSGSKNGTCYTAQECSSRGGSNAGSCAGGYGVCCTFSVNCGASSSENCTYFESTGSEIGGCKVDICRCNNNICQLRLDFDQFVISGPSTATVSIGKAIFGEVQSLQGKEVAQSSRCLTDTFSVTNGGGSNPPMICGMNNGEHMYVDASEGCNELVFQLGQSAVGTSISNRQWSIKVTQYSCDYNNLAPEGCTQYFFGDTSQTVQTYNFAGGQHLANQDQNICVRRERGNCRICWTTAMVTDFVVSGPTAAAKAFAKLDAAKACCSYGTDGMKTTGPDCLLIPGALKVKTTTKIGPSKYCGRSLGLGSSLSSGKAFTICSLRAPFNIRFMSDSHEFTKAAPSMEALKLDKGFKLVYFQNSNNC